jgi:hypothetical protein
MTREKKVAVGAVALLLLFPVAMGLAWAKKKEKPYILVPDLGEVDGVPVEIEEFQIHKEGVSATVAYVTGYVRRRMFEATLDIDVDPFRTPPGRPLLYHTFVITLENTAGVPWVFNGTTSQIIGSNDKRSFGMDYTYLYQVAGRSLDMDQFQKVVYDRPLTLYPGDKARKLLVFEEIDGKWKTLSLFLTLESDGMSQITLNAAFRKEFLGADS